MIKLNLGQSWQVSVRFPIAFRRLRLAFFLGMLSGIIFELKYIEWIWVVTHGYINVSIFLLPLMPEHLRPGKFLLNLLIFLSTSSMINVCFSGLPHSWYLVKIGSAFSSGSIVNDFLFIAMANLLVMALFYVYFFIDNIDILARVPLCYVFGNDEFSSNNESSSLSPKESVIPLLYPIGFINLILLIAAGLTGLPEALIIILGSSWAALFTSLGIFLLELIRSPKFRFPNEISS